MRILAALLIIISLILLGFGLLNLEAHAPPEAERAAPFMIGAGLFWLVVGIVIAVRTVRSE
jgi:cell division protein FtsW (lipid II flippase)